MTEDYTGVVVFERRRLSAYPGRTRLKYLNS